MEDQETEIPVWINGSEKLMTGLTKRTTCDDVIYSLVMNEGITSDDVDSLNYQVVEVWRKMERPLQGRIKIVKVWRAWGRERQNVRFVVRKMLVSSTAAFRTRRIRRHHRRSRPTEEFYDPEKARSEKMRLQNIEDLVHLVRDQQRRIQDQVERIGETDIAIEAFENKVHQQRMNKRGQNYVQDSYLSLHSLSDDSSGLEDALPNNIKECELEMYLKICDSIFDLEDKIAIQKQQIEEISFRVIEESNCGSDVDDSGLSSTRSDQSDYFPKEDKLLQDQLKIALSLTSYHRNELNKLSQNIAECDNALRRKHEYMEYLMKELDAAEKLERTYHAWDICATQDGADTHQIECQRIAVPVVSSSIGVDNKSCLNNSICRDNDGDVNPSPVRTVRFSDSDSFGGGWCSFTKPSHSLEVNGQGTRPLKSILKNTGYSFSCTDLHSFGKDVSKYTGDDHDSNSDTGLSSLHSDEALPILETLV